MDNSSAASVPAGWYPDPLGLPQLRWWNGLEWTDHTTEVRAPLVMQEGTSTPSASTRRERRDQAQSEKTSGRGQGRPALRQLEAPRAANLQAGIPEPMGPAGHDGQEAFADTRATDPQSRADQGPSLFFTDEPAASAEQQGRPQQHSSQQGASQQGASQLSASQQSASQQGASQRGAPEQRPTQQRAAQHGRANSPQSGRQQGTPVRPPHSARAPHQGNHNSAVWIIALTPMIQLILSLMMLGALGGPGDSESLAIIMTGLWIAPYPVTVALAVIDRAKLRKSGRQHTAHWLWALLTPPAYLIVRARASLRDSRGGLGPVLVWFAVFPLLFASVLAVPALLIATAPTTFSAEAEQSVMSTAALLGVNMTVACPPSPPTVWGQQFTCTAKTGPTESYKVDVSLQRVSGWISWRVDDWGIYSSG